MRSNLIVFAIIMASSVSIADAATVLSRPGDSEQASTARSGVLYLEFDWGNPLYLHTAGVAATLRSPSWGLGLKAQRRLTFGYSEYSDKTDYSALMLDLQPSWSLFYLNLGVARASTQIYEGGEGWWQLASRGIAGAVGLRWQWKRLVWGVGLLGGYQPKHKDQAEAQFAPYPPNEDQEARARITNEYRGAGFIGTGSIGVAL